MRLFAKIVTLMAGLILSAPVWAQTPTLSCRPLGQGNTYIAPDEQVVGYQVCKIVANSTPAQKPAQQSRAVATANPTPATGQNLATAQVVSPPAALSVAPAVTPIEPSEAGMYVANSGGFTKILGQIVEFERSGSLLASKVTLGLKSRKANAQLLGAHAQSVIGASPEFYFIPAKQEADAGVNAGDLILIRLERTGDRRQFEVGAEGDWRASKGISLTHQIQLNRSEVKPGIYKIAPATQLGRGEYGLYLARGEGLQPYIYDFTVE